MIDFKKQGIDWRCKTRMRSNSNEFLNSLSKSSNSRKSQNIAQMRLALGSDIESDSDTILSDDSEKMTIEGHHTILVSAIGNSFAVLLSPKESVVANEKDVWLSKAILQLRQMV